MELPEKYLTAHPYKLEYWIHKSEKQREIEKTYYIQDKVIKLKRLQELLQEDTEKEILKLQKMISGEENVIKNYKMQSDIIHQERFPIFGIKTHKEYNLYKQHGLFFYVDSQIMRRRQLEIEVYIEQLLQNAPIFNGINKEELIFYLIDQKYITHKNVLSTDFENFIFEDEYNNIIFDVLQEEIEKIDRVNARYVLKNYKKNL